MEDERAKAAPPAETVVSQSRRVNVELMEFTPKKDTKITKETRRSQRSHLEIFVFFVSTLCSLCSLFHHITPRSKFAACPPAIPFPARTSRQRSRTSSGA